jgi:hypothetical protein
VRIATITTVLQEIPHVMVCPEKNYDSGNCIDSRPQRRVCENALIA